MNRWTLALIMFVSAVLGTQAVPCRADTTAQEVEEANSLDSSLVTPHKPWGRGYVGGPVRTLMFVYTGPYEGAWEDTGTRVREAVELIERFDLQADAVLVCGKGEGQWTFHGQKLGEDRAERLLGKPYQLYIIAGFPMEKLPAKMQYLVLKQVAEGAGLVCCGPGAREYMVARRRVDPAPAFLTASLPTLGDKPLVETISAYNLGKGRGVWLNWSTRSFVPWQEFSIRGLNQLDYWMMVVGRAALWAAGREGEVTVDSVPSALPFGINRAEQANMGEVTISSRAQRPVQATVELELRRASDGLKTDLGAQQVTLPPGETVSVPVSLPRLRAGDYFVDAVVKSGRGVEAFGAGSLVVESDFGVEQVTLNASFVEVGEIIGGSVSLRGEPPAGSALRISLRDCYGRLLKQQEAPVAGGQAQPVFEWEALPFFT
ncbi:MAG TPA: hypothetical protein VM283_05550, partial [Armatimonadota bacterium]|nr:hypothetical protein [Armatimonadota bacterium]